MRRLVARRAFALIVLSALAVWALPSAPARAAESVIDRNIVVGAIRSFSTVRAAAIDGRIGIAPDDVAAAGAPPVFVDAMKQASAWSSPSALRLDALGNVVALTRGQSARTLVASGYPAGDYTLLFDGHGTLAADAGSIMSSGAGRVVLRVAPGSRGFHLILSATNSTDYVRNIRLVAPGFEATYTRSPFFPSYVSAMQRFAVLRFANWSHARTFVGALDWATRSTPEQFSQTSITGMAPEYMIALANATADDPWFVFPAGATDTYIAKFAQLVRATLDPRLHPTFEYGDAMWDPRTGAYRYATVAGLAARLTSLVPAAAPAWYALRSAQVFGLVMQAYGYDAGRVHRVLAGPLGLPGSAELTLTSALLHSPAARLADVFAVSDVYDPGQAFVAHARALAATAAVTKAARVPLWSYEADAAAVPIAIGRAQYDALFAGWHAAGGGLAVTSSQGPSTKWAGVADAMLSYPTSHLQPLPPSPTLLADAQSIARFKRPVARTPLATSAAITIVQNSGVQTRSSYGTFSLTLPTAPANGDLLVGIMEVTGAWQSTFPPPGWTALDNTNGAAGGHTSVVYAIVGSAGVTAATSYAMATVGGGVGELLDIRGQSSTVAPIAAADPSTFGTTVTRSLTIPTAGGMAITAAGLYSTGKLTALADGLPANYSESNLATAINGLSTEGNTFSLKTNVVNQDVYGAAQPFTFTTTATATVGSFPNSTLIWIPPSGASTPNPTPTPTATPIPNPTPTVSSAIAISQNSGVLTRSSYGTFSLTLPKPPVIGDMLVGIIEATGAWQSPFPPPGWTALDDTNGAAGGHISVVYAIVGSAGVPSATSYAMATVGGGVGELLEIRGQSPTIAPLAAADPSTFATTVTRSLTIPASGGLAITAAALFSSGTATSLTDTLPKNYTESNLVNAINGLSSEGNTFSLKTNVISQDAYTASQPFTFTTMATASVGSFPNSTLIWIAPSGSTTPAPTPTPTVTPAPTPTPTATPVPLPTPTLSTAITIAQNSGVQTRSSYGTFSLTLPAVPANGDTLLGIVEATGAWQSSFPPAGWTVLDDTNGATGGHLSVVYATVGSAGVPAATSYAMATIGGGVGELLAIRGRSPSIAPIAAADPSTFATAVMRSLTIPTAGGLAITAGGLFSNGTATALADTLPKNYTESTLVSALNGLSSEGNTFSLKTNVIAQDAYTAGQPFTFTTTASASVGSYPNSTLIWFAPAGASTPTPTPTPSPAGALNTWPMYGYDSAHDGYNPNSQLFTAANLANLHLGWQVSIPDYLTQTQPIVATNVGGHAGLLFAGGGSGAAYAYDALTGAQVWQTPSFGQVQFQCDGTSPTVGISGTAVYDPSSMSVYFVDGANASPDAPSTITLYRLNAATGAVLASVNINPGNLPGEVDYAHTGLTLANGMLYFGTGSTCDVSSWRGRLAAVNVGTMTLGNTFFTTYNQGGAYSGGGVWDWGGATIDASGNAYVGVGNADYNKSPIGPLPPFASTTNEQAGYGEHLVQLSGNLATVNASYAVPYAFSAAANDLDLSGTPVLYTPLGCPQLVAVQGKAGLLNFYNASSIGSGPLTSYRFSEMVGDVSYIGNGAYSPITGLYYANVPTSQGGSIRPPGMVAIGGCSPPAIQWSAQFGADSYGLGSYNGATRSAPTVTAGNVVFVATPTSAGTGQVWAIDAITGAVLNGGQPILTTGNQVLMPPVVDGDWMYVLDQGGNLYGLTLESVVPAIKAKLRHITLPRTHE